MSFSNIHLTWLTSALVLCRLAFCLQAADRTVMEGFVGQNWDISDGLPGTRISSVARTADGYVWLATPNGLSRFDGVRFFNLTPENTPALKVTAMRSLLTRRDGSLWIGTGSGALYRRAGDRYVEVDDGASLEGKSVLSLAEDSEGSLWIGTDGAGLFRITDGKPEAIRTENSERPARRVSQMTLDTEGRLWMLIDGQIYHVREGKVLPPTRSTFLMTPGLSMTSSRDGGLWVATEGDHYGGTRIHRLKDGAKTELDGPYPWAENSVRSRANALVEDRSGRLWCGTSGSGIFYRPPDGKWCKLDTHMPLSHAEGLCLMLDEGDSLWLGTRTSGLHHIRPQPPITRLHLPAEFDQNIVQSLCLKSDGTIWAGTDSAGLFRWIDGEPTHFFAEEKDQRFSVITEDRRGVLWAGTMAGLFRFQDGSFSPVRDHAALRHGGICDVLDDGKSGIWVGTLQGVVHLEEGAQRFFGQEQGLPRGLIRTLALDPDGRLTVIISGTGVFRQEGDHFARLSPPRMVGGNRHPWNEGPSAHARTLLYDADGSLWVATHGYGLWHLKGEEAKQCTHEEDGLPNNHLFGMVDDGRGNLWIGSESGILGISKQSLAQRHANRNVPLSTWLLTTSDGLAAKVCSGMGRTGAARSTAGMLWFANGPALAGFDPTKLAHISAPRPPLVEEVVIDGVSVARTQSAPIEVKSGARTYELHYTSPNLLNPGQQRFRYQLQGLDREWVDAGNRRVAYYNRLPPGNYEFKVKVAVNDDLWQEVPEPLQLEVIPHFHERPAVRTAAGLLLLAGVGGAVWQFERSRSRRRMERLKLQRAMDQERQRIARDIHDDLGSGLTEIILLSDTLREEVVTNQAAETSARAISNSARNLTRAMDEVVWAVNPGNDTLESFLNYLNDFAQEFLARAKVRYRWAAPDEVPPITLSAETRHSLYLACKEALNNATRHASASEVHIRLDLVPPGFSISIEDNGKGFHSDAVRKRGQGLGNMDQRLLDIGGKCEILGNPGGGSKVVFTISNPSQPI